MRTDSVNLSQTAIEAAKQQIVSAFGEEFSNPRTYVTKVASAQEAHEAIRPTDFSVRTAGESDAHSRLYDLVYKRAMASQMSDARIERTIATISISTLPDKLTATGEVLVFEGFLKLYLETSDDEPADDETSKMLPPISVGQELPLNMMSAKERFDRPPARYTEASLVKKLEELGIGRPSTYAPTITTIQARKYVVKEDRDGRQRSIRLFILSGGTVVRSVETENTGAERSKLFPTDIGSVVTDFLTTHFTEVLDYNFTATVEKQFDEIAQGTVRWTDMIRAFYEPFQIILKRTSETAERQSGERLIGVDPKSGKNVYVRLARYGPIAQIGDFDDEDKKQKGLSGTLSIETVTLEQALELFKFPRTIGLYEELPMDVKLGRFGPYIEHNKAFYSLAKEDDPYSIEAPRGIEILVARRIKIAENTLRVFEENESVKVLKGRWGPYIAVGKQNVRIPKGTDPLSLTLQDCLDLADQQEPKKTSKKSTEKTTTSKPPVAKKTVKKVAAKKKAVKKKVAVKKVPKN